MTREQHDYFEGLLEESDYWHSEHSAFEQAATLEMMRRTHNAAVRKCAETAEQEGDVRWNEMKSSILKNLIEP